MYLGLDTETGGLNSASSSLLTGFYGIFDKDFNLIEERNYLVKHPIYKVEAGALNVNKINVVEHDAAATPLEEISADLRSLVSKPTKLIPIGHNVDFDIGFSEQLVPDFRRLVDHRKLDTAVIGRFLKLVGLVPEELSGLESYCTYFKIPIQVHNAKGDALATVALLRAFMRLLQP